MNYIKLLMIWTLMCEIASGMTSCPIGIPCPRGAYIMRQENINADTRTIQGWIRVLKSDTKLRECGIVMSKNDREVVIRCLMQQLEVDKKMHKIS